MMSSPQMEKPDTGCYFFNYGPGGQNKALEEVWACQQRFLTGSTILDNDWPWSTDSDRPVEVVWILFLFPS